MQILRWPLLPLKSWARIWRPSWESAGFTALLSRAVFLAGGESAWLREVHVSAQGFLQGPDEIALHVDPEQVAQGKIALVSQLLGLLVTFVGENLTVR